MVHRAFFCGSCDNIYWNFRYKHQKQNSFSLMHLRTLIFMDGFIRVQLSGFIVVMIFLILKYLGACDAESSTVVEDTRQEINETYPIVPRKTVPQTYGTNEEDDDSGASSSSSEELYDEKLCVICYDEQRNCFFVPCGHCATCYDCAQRYILKDFNLFFFLM